MNNFTNATFAHVISIDRVADGVRFHCGAVNAKADCPAVTSLTDVLAPPNQPHSCKRHNTRYQNNHV
jgi:hypothetical protein